MALREISENMAFAKMSIFTVKQPIPVHPTEGCYSPLLKNWPLDEAWAGLSPSLTSDQGYNLKVLGIGYCWMKAHEGGNIKCRSVLAVSETLYQETMHSPLNLSCLSAHPLSKLLGGAAVDSHCYQPGADCSSI